MHPKEMLDLRADLQMKLLNREYRNSIAKTIAIATPQLVSDKKIDIAYEIADFSMIVAERAENFFIGADMSELIEHSSKMFDKTDQSDITLVPTKYGFAYFERPLALSDLRGSTVYINALLWYQDGNELIYHMWNDQRRSPDDVASMTEDQIREITGLGHKEQEHFNDLMGRWGYIGVHVYYDQSRLGANEVTLSEELAEQYSNEPGIIIHPITNVNRLIHAFFLMMQQPLAEAVVEHGDKKTGKRMKRAALPNEVTVIQFRRREYDKKDDGSKKKVKWTHQWLVRGYWRWQWYKDEDKTPFRRRIWIAPTVKGPKDKPLIINQKINALTR